MRAPDFETWIETSVFCSKWKNARMNIKEDSSVEKSLNDNLDFHEKLELDII